MIVLLRKRRRKEQRKKKSSENLERKEKEGEKIEKEELLSIVSRKERWEIQGKTRPSSPLRDMNAIDVNCLFG